MPVSLFSGATFFGFYSTGFRTRFCVLRSDCGQSKETSGAASFPAVGVVFVRIGGGAGAAVKNIAHAGFAGLTNNLCGEIHLVVRRADAGSNLHHKICRIGAERFAHRCDCFRHNSKFGALLSGVHEADCLDFPVCKINGCAVGDVNRKAQPGAIRDKTVGAGDVGEVRPIDSRHKVAMNLFGNGEWEAGESQRICRFAVDRPETTKSRLPIRHDVDAWAALNECRAKEGQGVERRKEFRRTRREGAAGGDRQVAVGRLQLGAPAADRSPSFPICSTRRESSFSFALVRVTATARLARWAGQDPLS